MNKIKIGGITYKIKYKEIECNDGFQLGETDYGKAQITINNHKIVKQKQDQTLMHEMVHAIMHEAGLDELNNDEVVVNQLGIVLYQVLKENNFDWLKEEEDK